MRKIIIPSDFSENAYTALKYATELFKYERSDFFLIHAYSEEVYNSSEKTKDNSFQKIKSEVYNSSMEKLEKIKKDITEYSPNPNHTFKLYSCFGFLVEEVNKLINLENADIIVMGTRGKTNNSTLTFGTNTVQVIKYVLCPVLCIPAFYKFKSFKRILFPTNYMLPYQRRELKLVAELARNFCAEMNLLYIAKLPQYSLRQRENQFFLQEAFNQIKVKLHTRYSFYKEDAINKFIGEEEIDMLVMVNSRQTYLESILAPSTVEKIGLNPHIPFLVLQNFNRVT